MVRVNPVGLGVRVNPAVSPKVNPAVHPRLRVNPTGKCSSTGVLGAETRATYGGLCGMPACGQAVGCGVCDTPELWCGAAGLCARVRACAGAAESLHTYIHVRG